MIIRVRHHPWLKSPPFEDRTFSPNWRNITYKYVLGSTQHKPPKVYGTPRSDIWVSRWAHLEAREPARSLAQLRICKPPAQVCARGRSPAVHSPRAAARWRHGRGSVGRFGPLQIRVCGKRGGAETRPGRGEDGPARQTDRGPGGRRAAHCSHVPPWIRRQPGPGLPTCPPGGSSSWGQGRARDPGQSGPRAPAASGASSGVGARVAAGVWGSKCLPWRTRDGWAAARRWVHGGVSGPGPALPAHGLGRRGEGKGSRRAGLAGVLAQIGAWQRGGWGAG